jgi:hypothetical protein
MWGGVAENGWRRVVGGWEKSGGRFITLKILLP